MRVVLFPFLVILVVTAFSCKKDAGDPAPSTGTSTPSTPSVPDDFFNVYYSLTDLPISTLFDSARKVGVVQNLALDEISGIAESYSVPGALWAEEDSGNENNIYLLDSTGVQLASFTMSSEDDRDWEDMSIAPGPINGIHYIYLAETGDNKLAYSTKYIYRFPEPSLNGQKPPISSSIQTGVDKISFQYPDGIKNTEAVMIDPLTKDIYLVSKENEAVVYVARYPQDLTKVITVTKLGILPISDVTAADISPDGTEILIKNYTQLLYWKRAVSDDIKTVLQQVPKRLNYLPEPQGESVCWARNGGGFFTTSEEVGNQIPVIYYYKRR